MKTASVISGRPGGRRDNGLSASVPPPESGRGSSFSRLILPLALLVLAAMLSCAVLGYSFARQTESGRLSAQREKLHAAIAETRASFNETVPSPGIMRDIERNVGLKELRFESEPVAGEESLPLLNPNGRILGWFNWTADRGATDIFDRLWPLIVFTFATLMAFLALVVWQLRRAARAVAAQTALARKLASDDALTGLPHRGAMFGILDRALAAHTPERIVVFAHIGLDGFKAVNDALGQTIGNEALAAVAERLRAALPEGGVGSRFGGDEFAVLFGAPNADEAAIIVTRMAAALVRPYWVNDRALQIGASTGYAWSSEPRVTADALARQANLALNVAKAKKRGHVVGFEPAMDAEFAERHFIERELKRALVAGDLHLHYQPLVNASGSGIVGVEALLRWNHPERGPIPPLSFVAVAERTGLMRELGQFVLRQALADAKNWGGLTIAVNLSPVQVHDPALVDHVANALQEFGIAPERLLLEVTEGVLIDKPDEAKQRLGALRELGVRLALDDFGTGYSSLGYLQNFKFDKLKIDRSFVMPLGRNGNAAPMIQAIVALGRALGMTILAEGVETEEQRVLLRLAGCDEMQGFLFSKPVARETIDQLLIDARLRAATSKAQRGLTA